MIDCDAISLEQDITFMDTETGNNIDFTLPAVMILLL